MKRYGGRIHYNRCRPTIILHPGRSGTQSARYHCLFWSVFSLNTLIEFFFSYFAFAVNGFTRWQLAED